MSERSHHHIVQRLETVGADLSRWPQDEARQARAMLLASPDFRRAYEAARRLDGMLTDERASRDNALAQSDASARVRRSVLAQLPAQIPWRSVAAAMIAAAMLGGAMDLFISARANEASDALILDPLFAIEEAGAQ